jgi:DNA processing protein
MSSKTISLSVPPREMTPDDPEWPESLADLEDPPLWLRIAGSLPPLSNSVAIVGTRAADDEAVEFTRRLSVELSAAGCTIVSGGAYGIDAAAHQGALEVSGHTVAVLATGLREAYPGRHGPLFGRIARRGALLTEAPDHQGIHAGLFLRRNRLVAALARVVVVVQAPKKSGALSTAAWAGQVGRPVLAVPSAPWEPRGEGCLHLLRSGAKICTSARDVLSLRSIEGDPGPWETAESDENRRNSNKLDEDECKVLGILGSRPRHADEVARRSGLPVSRVQRALLTLALQGIVEERGNGRYAKKAG